jgi:hypothetical protein
MAGRPAAVAAGVHRLTTAREIRLIQAKQHIGALPCLPVGKPLGDGDTRYLKAAQRPVQETRRNA